MHGAADNTRASTHDRRFKLGHRKLQLKPHVSKAGFMKGHMNVGLIALGGLGFIKSTPLLLPGVWVCVSPCWQQQIAAAPP